MKLFNKQNYHNKLFNKTNLAPMMFNKLQWSSNGHMINHHNDEHKVKHNNLELSSHRKR